MQDLPVEMKLGLRNYGIQEARLSRFSLRTRVMKDLRICGDGFGPFYECLARAYDSPGPVPPEILSFEIGNDCLFVKLGAFIPFFDRFIKGPDLTLKRLHSHLRR